MTTIAERAPTELREEAIEILENKIPERISEFRKRMFDEGLSAQWVVCPFFFHYNKMVRAGGGQLSWHLSVYWDTIIEGNIAASMTINFVGGQLGYPSTKKDKDNIPSVQENIGSGGITRNPVWEELFEENIVPETVVALYEDIEASLKEMHKRIVKEVHKEAGKMYGDAANQVIRVANELKKMKLERRN